MENTKNEKKCAIHDVGKRNLPNSNSQNWDDIESEYYKQTGDISSHEIFTEWLKFHYKVP